MKSLINISSYKYVIGFPLRLNRQMKLKRFILHKSNRPIKIQTVVYPIIVDQNLVAKKRQAIRASK
jgi:hypothetical protein